MHPMKQIVGENKVTKSFHLVLSHKFEEMREAMLHRAPTEQVTKFDPLTLKPFHFVLRETYGQFNFTIYNCSVEGLSDFSIRDVASNLRQKKTSILLKFPEIKITASYRLEGETINSSRIIDEGIYTSTIVNGASAWLASFQVSDYGFRVTESFLKIFFDEITSNFSSKMITNETNTKRYTDLFHAAKINVAEHINFIFEDLLDSGVNAVIPTGKKLYFPLSLTEAVTKEMSKSISRQKRQIPCENGEQLNEYVDTLFRFARRIFRFMEPVRTLNMTVKVDELLLVYLYDLRIRGISTINRTREAYVFCKNDSISLGMIVTLDRFVLAAKYRLMKDYELLLFNGDLEVTTDRPEIFVQISQVMDPEPRPVLDKIKIWRLGKINIKLRGLGNLTSAVSMLINRIVNEDPTVFLPVVEAQMHTIIANQLAAINIPIFSVV